MVRNSKTKIIEERLFISESEIMDLKLLKRYLKNNFSPLLLQNELLSRLVLIKNTMDCDECQIMMRYVQRKSSLGGYVCICRKPCYRSKSYKIILFLNSKLKIELFLVCYKNI
ncbi:hypothetical protein DMUE_4932 [Dictyocoela muelleri]|nr:hypothetical protein DMUE_4932 [Dictyocoela muelleri]